MHFIAILARRVREAGASSNNVSREAKLLGIAYDEYIEEGNTAVPSDNFDEYRLCTRKKSVPVTGPRGNGRPVESEIKAEDS